MAEPLENGQLDRLEIEIHREKVRVWVDGATAFLADEKKVQVLIALIEQTLDAWLRSRIKTALAGFGLAAIGSLLLAWLAWLGWKGWGGK
jgi:hypothetical protein